MAPDYKVYNHFKPIFEKKLESFGQDRMAEEIRDLRRVNEEVMKRCKFSEVDNAKLSGENKWWGTANLMGYLVKYLEKLLDLFKRQFDSMILLVLTLNGNGCGIKTIKRGSM